MSTYRAHEVTGSRRFELVDRDLVGPRPDHARVRVHSCGVCHSDTLAVEGMRKGFDQPIVPGHEIVGVIDAVGSEVAKWAVGDRVGVGFLGGHCGVCPSCRRGDFMYCEDQPRPGTTEDGGYAEYVYVRASGLVRVPVELDSLHASPLLCAGITTFNALRTTCAMRITTLLFNADFGHGVLHPADEPQTEEIDSADAICRHSPDIMSLIGTDTLRVASIENARTTWRLVIGAAQSVVQPSRSLGRVRIRCQYSTRRGRTVQSLGDRFGCQVIHEGAR